MRENKQINGERKKKISFYYLLVTIMVTLLIPALAHPYDSGKNPPVAGIENSVKSIVEKAEFLSQLGKEEAALPLFQEAVEHAPPSDLKARAIAGQAKILTSFGDTKKASELYNSAWKLASNPETKLRILVGQVGIDMADLTISADARRKLKTATTLSDKTVDPLTKMSLLFVKACVAILDRDASKGRRLFAETQKYAEQIIKGAKDPEHKVTFMLYNAAILMSQQKLNEARRQSEAALVLTSDLLKKTQILQFQGMLYEEQKRYSEARSKFEESLKIATDADSRAYALIALGEITERQGNYAGALKSYEAALREKMTDNVKSFALFKKGTVLLRLERLEESQQVLESVIPLTMKESRAARALANIALILKVQGKYKEARAKLEQALSYKCVRPSIRDFIQRRLDDLKKHKD